MHRLRSLCCRLVVIGSLFMAFSQPLLGQDVIEFLSGASQAGKVVRILKAEKKVIFESKLAKRTARRTYPYSKIHAIEYKGKRFVLNKLPEEDGKPQRRTSQEIDALIERVGSTPPDWLAETPLNYPETLDLSWPFPPPKPWNNRKNVGQHIWEE